MSLRCSVICSDTPVIHLTHHCVFVSWTLVTRRVSYLSPLTSCCALIHSFIMFWKTNLKSDLTSCRAARFSFHVVTESLHKTIKTVSLTTHNVTTDVTLMCQRWLFARITHTSTTHIDSHPVHIQYTDRNRHVQYPHSCYWAMLFCRVMLLAVKGSLYSFCL